MDVMPLTAPLQAALGELREGRGAQGETLVVAALREARARHGRRSFENAAALFDLGRFYAVSRNLPQAAEAMRCAVDLKLPGDRWTKDRLSYLATLGEILMFDGRYDAALDALRESAEGRLAFYGAEHSEYASGLGPLAEVLWRAGKSDEALPLIRKAVEILVADGQPKVISTLAFRAFIHHAAKQSGSAFADLPRMLDELRDELVANIVHTAGHMKDKAAALLVLNDLRGWIESHWGQEHRALVTVLVGIADCKRVLGDHKAQQGNLFRLLGLFQSSGETTHAIKVLQLLAEAHVAAGQTVEAERTYDQALALARDHGDHRRLTNVLRSFGQFRQAQGRLDEAEALFGEAALEAHAADDPEAESRALIALGILLQHGGRPDQARPILEAVLDLLPPKRPDLLAVRSHLTAIESGGSCGCADMGFSVSERLRALVLPSLPPGLLKDLRWEPGKGVQMSLSRAATAEEQKLLQGVLDHVLEELRPEDDAAGSQ
jgi:tetratricopeptide (TPR) repeat protein